jgi:CHAT domain-containing protein/tetratricopeptide (TPR) repeat protein
MTVLHAVPESASRAGHWALVASEIDRLNRSDPAAALARANAWVEAEQADGSPEGVARALRSHAHAVRFLGQSEQAIREYEEAEARFAALGNFDEEARTQIGHVTALRYVGRYEDAVELAMRSRRYFIEHGLEIEIAKQSNNLGTVYRPMGRLSAALSAYRAARTVFAKLRQRGPLADVEQNIGNVLVDLGRYEEALGHLNRARALRSALKLRSEVALTLQNIGILSRRRGDYGGALHALTEARTMYEALGVDRGLAIVDLELLPTLAALNLVDEARQAAGRAISGLRALEMPFELGQALLSLGQMASSAEQWPVAQGAIGEAREIFARQGNTLWEARAALAEVDIALRGTDEPDLDTALTICRQAISYFESVGSREGAASGRLNEGQILLARGEEDRALLSFEEVIKEGAPLGADHLMYQAHAALGDMLAMSDAEVAIDHFEKAADHLDALRMRARADDLKLAFQTDKGQLYEQAVALLVEMGSPEAIRRAYGFVERSKSRSLVEELLGGTWRPSSRQRSASDKLLRRVRDIRARLNAAYVQAYAADATPSERSLERSQDANGVGSLEREFAAAVRELQLSARGGEAGETEHVDGLAPLPSGTALLEFFSVGPHLIAFVRTGAAVEVRVITTMDVVEELAEGLAFQIQRATLEQDTLRLAPGRLRRGMDHCLRNLYDTLIAPLEADLQGVERLIVVPHGPLHGLPFHAFLGPDGYLVDLLTVQYAPSATVWQRCREVARPLGQRAAIVGIDDPELPSISGELIGVASVWPSPKVLDGERATQRALKRLAGKIDVLHLATHAVFRSDNPEFSSIKLADAWLTVSDLAEIAHGAQLVTLSACETGKTGIKAGDEALGLTRGLLGAGCPLVVASLWSVNDGSTALLMNHFYQGLGEGLAPVEALRQAMQKVRNEHEHPYSWAPFVVLGDGPGRPAEDRVDVEANRQALALAGAGVRGHGTRGRRRAARPQA